MPEAEQIKVLQKEIDEDIKQKGKFNLMLTRQEIVEKFSFAESYSVIDVFRFLYDQI